MRTDEKTARKIGALYFDERTILEIKQLGGGGSGVGGANGLNARNLVTGEDTGEVIAAQAEQITEQGAEIDTLTEQNTELQAENATLTARNVELTEWLEEAEEALLPKNFLTILVYNNPGFDILLENDMASNGASNVSYSTSQYVLLSNGTYRNGFILNIIKPRGGSTPTATGTNCTLEAFTTVGTFLTNYSLTRYYIKPVDPAQQVTVTLTA